ncbi:MAG TPA: alpha/beta hydrolase [Nocardioidaceae bacterium]|nr:alpha/beta hydrolase [Nocardioidaceae bacterium]
MNIARRGLAVIAAVALLGSACSGGDDSESDDPAASPTSDEPPTGQPSRFKSVADFADQTLDWASCGDFECGSIEVPVDYADPSGDTVELELKRSPATGDPVGTLFINPGGPGASGVDYVEAIASELSEEMLSRYDIVGFDPRGVGESDPLVCLDDAELDELVSFDPDPDTPDEEAQARDLIEGLGEACADEGELASHVSTVEVARDLDIMRAAVGDQKLTYYGASYGTYIGATYAELFPGQVGRMVLDGAIDARLSANQINLQQAAGFQTALEAYIDDCIAGTDCPLDSDPDAAMEQIRSFLETLDQHPLDSGDSDRPLTEALGFYGIALPLYSRDYWPLLTQGLTAAFDGDGSLLLRFADTYLSRTSSGYSDNSAQVIYAVNCLDRPVQLSNDQIRRSVPSYERASPVFGRVFAWSMLGCSDWPLKPSEPAPVIDGAGAPPIVVVGTTRDPATPYHWAEALASELKSGVLVSRDGDGHTGYHMGNSCVDDAIDRYFLDGDVPEDGLSC